MTAIFYVLRFVVGAIIGFGTALALTPAAIATVRDQDGSIGATVLVVAVLTSGLFAAFAPSLRRAFGRSFLLLGASLFILPLTSMAMSGVAFQQVTAQNTGLDGGAAAIGAGLAAVVITGLGTFVGFFLGTVFLIAGLILVLGGRREVIVISQAPPAKPYAPYGGGNNIPRRDPPALRKD